VSGIAKISISGLREFQAGLRKMDAGLPRQLRLVLNEASGIIVDYDRAHMPRKTGRAIGSVKARSSQRLAQVAIGGNKAPYTPWLDFGGQGKHAGRPAPRPFIKDGRYTYQGLKVHRQDITDIMAAGIVDLARQAGIEATSDA
jgi:hypothetical protein